MSVLLLVQDSQGGTVAVRFPDAATAQAWEDEHLYDVTAVGVVKVVSKAEALRLAGAP